MSPARVTKRRMAGQDHAVITVAGGLGQFDPRRVRSDVPLFGSYYEMAVANGVPPDDPALDGCKRWA